MIFVWEWAQLRARAFAFAVETHGKALPGPTRCVSAVTSTSIQFHVFDNARWTPAALLPIMRVCFTLPLTLIARIPVHDGYAEICVATSIKRVWPQQFDISPQRHSLPLPAFEHPASRPFNRWLPIDPSRLIPSIPFYSLFLFWRSPRCIPYHFTTLLPPCRPPRSPPPCLARSLRSPSLPHRTSSARTLALLHQCFSRCSTLSPVRQSHHSAASPRGLLRCRWQPHAHHHSSLLAEHSPLRYPPIVRFYRRNSPVRATTILPGDPPRGCV